MTEPEEWRPVVGWEGLYEVSSLGRVRSVDRVVVRTWPQLAGFTVFTEKGSPPVMPTPYMPKVGGVRITLS